MSHLALIRHGPTEWNEAKRLQGQTDVPLSERGQAAVDKWQVPDEFKDWIWYASPMTRAQQTAASLGLEVIPEPSLVEMHWGDWEGKTREEIKAAYGDEFRQRAAKGLDLRPHNGESPREVRARVADWIVKIAATGEKTGAVCHQGIIRAALSLATGWEMTGPPPYEMDWESVHVFALDPDGTVSVDRLNVSMVGK